ncbi:hypothetical protein BU16DRAFT_586038 [Lophium mytilinum]|uniref:Uncharacterized protein n=1 Tax=Lophium mytilinum TaxID=390894 RepID=A0A6A6QCR3_9PEZI|nr:hypothetical protein BU16DRAFT_586038 [Lophium mytilinum]
MLLFYLFLCIAAVVRSKPTSASRRDDPSEYILKCQSKPLKKGFSVFTKTDGQNAIQQFCNNKTYLDTRLTLPIEFVGDKTIKGNPQALQIHDVIPIDGGNSNLLVGLTLSAGDDYAEGMIVSTIFTGSTDAEKIGDCVTQFNKIMDGNTQFNKAIDGCFDGSPDTQQIGGSLSYYFCGEFNLVAVLKGQTDPLMAPTDFGAPKCSDAPVVKGVREGCICTYSSRPHQETRLCEPKAGCSSITNISGLAPYTGPQGCP